MNHLTNKMQIPILKLFNKVLISKNKKLKKLKVLTVVGTRPEIIRLSCVLQALEAHEAIDHTLVHTGQNYDYELNEIFFEDLGIKKPDFF